MRIVSVVSVVVSVVRWEVSVGDSVVVACVSVVISSSLFNYVSSPNFFFSLRTYCSFFSELSWDVTELVPELLG